MTVFYHFDLITGGLYFRQDMGRKHNCPFSSDLLNQVSDLYDLHRIEPVRPVPQSADYERLPVQFPPVADNPRTNFRSTAF